jgi:hypothetical protein
MKGVEHEREEHKDLYDRCMAGECPPEEEFFGMIAEAHLREDPEYYTHLEEMEEGGEAEEAPEQEQEQETEQETGKEPPMSSMRPSDKMKPTGRGAALQRQLRPY